MSNGVRKGRGFDIRVQREGSDRRNEKVQGWGADGGFPEAWEEIKQDPTVVSAKLTPGYQRACLLIAAVVGTVIARHTATQGEARQAISTEPEPAGDIPGRSACNSGPLVIDASRLQMQGCPPRRLGASAPAEVEQGALPMYCDHRSVGVILRNPEGRILLFERNTFPPGFACVAGHVDQHSSFEDAARAEVWEEVGLVVTHLELATTGRIPYACRRIPTQTVGHYCQIYYASVEGYEIRPSEREVRNPRWYSVEEIKAMQYVLEPAWRDWFRLLKILAD